MSEHPHAELVRELLAALRAADTDRVEALLPETCVWHVPGRAGKLAGSHRGREAIAALARRLPDLCDGEFERHLIDVLANDHNAVALLRATGEREGRHLDTPICLRLRIEQEQVVEVWEFAWDLYQLDEFWS
ncbi:MAG: nuclear transport factor 2 family protein [Proteobacteria bacterium]|nr:nuclear transport factor 2 family protein [Pseudomonadota bacterium]